MLVYRRVIHSWLEDLHFGFWGMGLCEPWLLQNPVVEIRQFLPIQMAIGGPCPWTNPSSKPKRKSFPRTPWVTSASRSQSQSTCNLGQIAGTVLCHGFCDTSELVLQPTYKKLLKMAIEIVNLPIKNSHVNLVGGDLTILKNGGVRQWLVDDPIYEMENNPNVWNHQPVNIE